MLGKYPPAKPGSGQPDDLIQALADLGKHKHDIGVSFATVLPHAESATIVPLMRTELVTTLKRQATELLADIERDKQPILITQHGLPSAYLVDVETFELLQQRMAVLEGIARGEMAVAEGRVVSHAEARTRMGRWLK